MNISLKNITWVLFLLFSNMLVAQLNSSENDSAYKKLIKDYDQILSEINYQKEIISLRQMDLKRKLNNSHFLDTLSVNNPKKNQTGINASSKNESYTSKRQKIDVQRKKVKGYPVMGILNDTILFIHAKIGELTIEERASLISTKILELSEDDFLIIDSIQIMTSDDAFEIVYKEKTIMRVSESDAIWNNSEIRELAKNHHQKIVNSIVLGKIEKGFAKTLLRIGLILIVFIIAWLIFWLINRGYKKLAMNIQSNKEKWLKDLAYNNYTFLTEEQELNVILMFFKISRWLLYLVFLYISLPILFSIFPFSRAWAEILFSLVWLPFKSVLYAVWHFLPNLFSILVIFLVMRYFIKAVKYIFSEIEMEKLTIAGFHPDWSMPTYGIIRVLLYAFSFVLIFPYLPGSDSNIFKGVSVFIGILFSLGSSTAIANMVAGLVITYMRPFKIGDRIKIAQTSGDVIEKSLLVTRIKTSKNEIITIPNSSILAGNTVNYSSDVKNEGLIIYTTVTIGYDVPWKNMYEALIEAALKTQFILKEPKPFVLQTSLDDFYVSYQINSYTKTPNKQARIYSNLHQNIQDVCNERGIEILSPHYRSSRDGNMTTIPSNYLPKDYEVPAFNVNLNKL